jgi:hypothetical protein
MKPKLILCLTLVLSGGLFGGYDVANANETKTNGFLVFEIDRYTYNMEKNRAVGSEITQKFKIPLTEEFLSNFKYLPSKNSSGTGFCCGGGDLKTKDGGTHFTWWIRKTTDNRWVINMWGEGAEAINGDTVTSHNAKASQSLTIKQLEDLDMSYMLSYFNKSIGLNVEFTAKYVAAKDIDADGPIPAAPVRKADRTILYKGDDLKNYPLEISGLFQED